MVPYDEQMHYMINGTVKTNNNPTLTYRLDNKGKRIDGHVDRLTAMLQSIWKELMTEQGEYVIYSNSYGLKTRDLIGKNKLYAYTKAVYRIKQLLKKDSRVIRSYDFKKIEEESKKEKLTISFKVDTIFGKHAFQGVRVLD